MNTTEIMIPVDTTYHCPNIHFNNACYFLQIQFFGLCECCIAELRDDIESRT